MCFGTQAAAPTTPAPYTVANSSSQVTETNPAVTPNQDAATGITPTASATPQQTAYTFGPSQAGLASPSPM